MVRSDSKKCVLLMELAVTWEEDTEEPDEQKKNRYESLQTDSTERSWIYHVLATEMDAMVS